MATEFIHRPYQEAGDELVMSSPEGCYLAFAPGSGKTATAFLAADKLMHGTLEHQRTLVVGPKLVAQEVWTREADKWSQVAHLAVWHIETSVFGYKRTVTTHTDGLVSIDETKVEPADIKAVRARILAQHETVMTVSRDNFWWLVRVMGRSWPWDLVIWDESTSLKTHDSNRSKAMRYLRKHGYVKRLILLSGTPRPKSVEQVWSQVRLIDGGQRLGATLGEFRKRYMLPTQLEVKGRTVTKWIDRDDSLDAVLAQIRDICLAVPPEVWRKTEPPRVVERLVALPPRARAIYDQLKDLRRAVVDGTTIAAPEAAVRAGKALQVAAGFIYDDDGNTHWLHDQKIDALEELLEELDGEPLVVLYWHQAMFERLKKRFGKLLWTTKDKGFLDQFAAGKIKLLALHPASAGHGLDGLQNGGHHVAAVEIFPDWELFQQAVSRLDRSGQKHRVTIHMIKAQATRDRVIGAILADREASQAQIMEALKA